MEDRLRAPRWLQAVNRGTLLAALIALAWNAVQAAKLMLPPSSRPWAAIATEVQLSWAGDFMLCAAMIAGAWLGHRALARPGRPTPWPRLLALAAAVTVASVGVLLLQLPWRMPGQALDWAFLPYLLVRHGALVLLLVALREFGARREAALQALHRAECERASTQCDLDEAQHRLLQAQIEPHFLFNSLANVRRLMRTDPAAARELLGALRRYLEHALPRLRAECATLGREAELVRAFLAVHRVRMGARLDARVEVPAALAGHEVPALGLLTLVENALQHGLSPLPEGGTLSVGARTDGQRLVLTVADTGAGMGCGSGSGVGLANLKARLRARHGDAASLVLRLNEPRGVVAEITLPLSTVASAAVATPADEAVAA